MKIVFNTDQIFLHGGIEKTMATKANYFATLPNVEVYIVTTEQHGNLPCYPLSNTVNHIDLGVDYDREQSYFSKSNLKKTYHHFRRQKKLFKIIKPDVIISPNFNFDHYWLPFVYNKAVIIKERHSSRFYEKYIRKNNSFLSKIKFAFNDWIDSQYDHIVVLNKDEGEYVKSRNAVVIPNSISIPKYQAELKRKTVIAAGRISPVKAFEQLIEAWSIIADKFPDWELHIYGEDYLNTKDELLKLIDTMHLQNVVCIKESVSDLPKAMCDYSIYAMSSLTECFPMVLLEALSVGLPIVSYDCPNGPRNIITDGNDGLLAEYKNPDDLAQKIMLLLADDCLRIEMGERGRQNVDRFENQSVMRLWNKLLNLSDV